MKKIVILLVVFQLIIIGVSAHDTGEPHPEYASGINSWNSVSPFSYISQGNYGMGIFMAFLWIVTTIGLIILFFMVFERMIKPNAKV